MHRLDEFVAGIHSAAGSEEVIMEHDDIIRCDRVGVEFDHIDAILFGIRLLDCDRGEFAGFSGGHEAATEFVGEYRTADKAAAFDTERSARASDIRWRASPFLIRVVRSRNMIPLEGKSGTSRMVSLRSSIVIAL